MEEPLESQIGALQTWSDDHCFVRVEMLMAELRDGTLLRIVDRGRDGSLEDDSWLGRCYQVPASMWECLCLRLHEHLQYKMLQLSQSTPAWRMHNTNLLPFLLCISSPIIALNLGSCSSREEPPSLQN
jgi:hypothetical protein